MHKKRAFIFFILFLFYTYFAFAEEENISVIKIENAQKTEYYKDSQTEEEIIELTGTVSISVSKGNTVTRITASKITFNRNTSMLFAQDGVTLKKKGGSDGDQDISADTLLFNTDTLEGIFDNGRVVQTQSSAINLPSGSTIVVFADIFGRDSESTIAFKNAFLTFCPELDPHWKIWASRIWLLPGNEFAFFNAVLFIGHIPILYLPAFYYPKDELVFNPSFGYDNRKGYFIQNTIYLYGRKPLEEVSDDSDDVGKGLYNFMRPTELKEQRQEGLILHNLDQPYTGNTTNYFKVMADYYTTLGGMVGFEGQKKNGDYISNLFANAHIGFSNTIFYSSKGKYIPYSSSGTMYKDESNFLGLQLPFRYGTDLELTLKNPLTLNISMPIYSDPYFKDDFEDRSEYMDWIGFFMNNSEDDDDDDTTVTSLTWSMTGSYKIPFPSIINPYISTVEFTSFSSQLIFSSKTNALSSSDNWSTYSPQRLFYYPSSITPIKFSLKIAGTLYQTDYTKSSKESVNFPIPLEAPNELSKKKEDLEDEDKTEDEEEGSEAEDHSETFSLDIPDLNTQEAASPFTVSGINYSLGYSIIPQFTSQLTYDASELSAPEDFNWNELQSSYMQIKVPITLDSTLSYRDNLLSVTNTLLFSPVYQEHPNLDGYSESSAKSIKTTDYNARKLDLSESNVISFKPFIYNSVFKDTGLTWNTTVQLIRTEFLGDADNPEWEYLTMDISDEDCVTVHTLSGLLSAQESDDFKQTLELSTTLPPQTDEYTCTLGFTFPGTTLSFASGIKKTTTSSSSSSADEWELEPFKQSLSVNLFSKNLVFTESFNYNLEDGYADSLKLSLTLWQKLQASYIMSYTYGYDFDSNLGWEVRSTKEFLAESASLALTLPAKNYHYWKNRIAWAPSLSTSVVYDFLRPTNSYFKFIPALTFKINDFLNLTFSAESKNSVIYRYFQEYTGSNIQLPGETNILKDLINSFAFWGDDTLFDSEQTKRKASGFKLKSFKIAITHELCDWDFSASYSVSPRLTTVDGKKVYNFDPYINISVSWHPLSSIKASVTDNYGTWKLNSSDDD